MLYNTNTNTYIQTHPILYNTNAYIQQYKCVQFKS